MRRPLVSIGMPVYNDIGFIGLSIESLLNQTFKDFELIISDDCSTDGSQDICMHYANNDSRVVYIRQEKNIGISKNMEFLLSKASGKYFMWAGDDDICDPDFIKVLYTLLKDNPKCISAFTPWVSINEENEIIKGTLRRANYASSFALIRLLKLCFYWDDGFGYGLFVKDRIQKVQFPVWWWINKKRAYNNIYPTLFYYLSRGNFVLYQGDALWFNRQKNSLHVNHKLPYVDSFCRGLFANCLWKFNVYVKCMQSIFRATKWGTLYALFLLPVFFLYYLFHCVKIGGVFFLRLILGKCHLF